MLLAMIYEYTWTIPHLLVLYLLIYFADPYNFFSPKGWFDKPEIYISKKFEKYEKKLLEAAEKSSNNFSKYYFLSLTFIVQKLNNAWDKGPCLIPYSLSRPDKLFIILMSIWIQILLLPLMITFYWSFILYWLLKLMYYWIISKFLSKKFRLTDKAGVNRINPVTFDNNDIIIPVNCRTHDFIPQICYSFKKSSKIYPSVNYGFLEVNNHELWHYEPLINISFKKLLTKFLIELLIRMVIKRPYIWAFHFWSRLVAILLKINKKATFKNLIYGALKSVSCILIVGVPIYIIDFTAFIITNYRFSFNTKKLRTDLHVFFVNNIFKKFAKENADVLYSSPFPVDVDNIRPL